MNVTLRPDRKLLDANFESYKLSLEKIPIFKAQVPGSMEYSALNSSLSKQHLKAYSWQNCLACDPFHSGLVYYITSHGKIFGIAIPENAVNFNPGFSAGEVPNWKPGSVKGQLFASLRFASPVTAIVYDGVNSLTIFDTSCVQRENTAEGPAAWKAISTIQSPLDSNEAILLDAYSSTDRAEIHCLFGSVVHRPDTLPPMNGSKSSYITYLDWLTFQITDSQHSLHRHRKFAAPSFPDYVAFEQNTGALHVCAERQFVPIFDSCNPAIAEALKKVPEETSEKTAVTPVFPIHWSQTESTAEDDTGSVVIAFQLTETNLPASVSKQSVQTTIAPRVPSSEDEHQCITVRIASSLLDTTAPADAYTTLLEHNLYGCVDGDAVWSLDREKQMLEVHLNKTHALHWPRLLYDAIVDQQLVTPTHPTHHIASEVENIQDRHVNPGTGGGDEAASQSATLKPAFNVEQLEDVDFPMDQDEDDLVLQRFDAESLEVTHQASLSGNQWLLNVPSDRSASHAPEATNALCIRQDVDGIVWIPNHSLAATATETTPKSKKRPERGKVASPWSHACTLQAFGYVLASKRDHRFVSAPLLTPDNPLPFVAVADSSKRIYVYRQPLKSTEFPSGDTELRRRKVAKTDESTPEGVVHVAWQHVICLPDQEDIIGFVALSKPYPVCVVCTQTNLYLLSLIG